MENTQQKEGRAQFLEREKKKPTEERKREKIELFLLII